ncbi:hypothetical protein DMI62_19900 [Escherichia coli]|nr:hypothetical protein [Escherichia coli]
MVAGILILGTVENAMNPLNISPFAQYVVPRLNLLAAVIFDRYKAKANAMSDAFFYNNLAFFSHHSQPPQRLAVLRCKWRPPSHCLYYMFVSAFCATQ